MSDLPRRNADRLARTLSMHATPVRILDADRIVWAA